jgi:hypothetical protein
MGNTLLGKAGANDVARQIFQSLSVTGPDGPAAVYVKAAVTPFKHVFDKSLCYLAFFFEHLEHFLSKQVLQQRGLVGGTDLKNIIEAKHPPVEITCK